MTVVPIDRQPLWVVCRAQVFLRRELYGTLKLHTEAHHAIVPFGHEWAMTLFRRNLEI